MEPRADGGCSRTSAATAGHHKVRNFLFSATGEQAELSPHQGGGRKLVWQASSVSCHADKDGDYKRTV